MSQQTENSNTHLYSDEQAPSTKPPQLSETIWHLPRQYVKVLFRPSAQTFREEMGKAGWGIVLIFVSSASSPRRLRRRVRCRGSWPSASNAAAPFAGRPAARSP